MNLDFLHSPHTGDTGDVPVLVKRLPHGQDLPLPHYATELSAGMDIAAAVDEPLEIASGAIALVPTGLAAAIRPGYEIQIRPRSGLAIKQGLTIVNAPGTIDADYRGEIKIGLINLGREPVLIRRGDRIAQMILSRVWRVAWHEVDALPETKRGEGGFGHTGS